MQFKFRWWIVVLLISLPLIHFYALPGFPQTQDGTWAIIRQAEMHREIKDLQFPPRWAGYLNHGFGYPLFLFTYPLPYLVGELVHLAGLGVVDTVKLLFIATTLGSALSMFLFAKGLWGNWGGLLSTVLYVYAPYRLLNLSKRGSLGELTAFIFYPLLFYLFPKLLLKPSAGLVLLTSLAFGLFMISHNASVVLFLPLLGFWICWVWRDIKSQKGIYAAVTATVVGLLLSAWFWLPAIVEKKYIALSQFPLADKSEHFLDFFILIGRRLHETSGLTLEIGFLHLALLVMVIVFLNLQEKVTQYKTYAYYFLCTTFVGIFLLTSFSKPIWHLPLLSEIDFPWRMLGVVCFLLSALGGMVLVRVKKNMVWVVICATLFLAISSNKYLKDVQRKTEPDTYYETNDATTTSNDELLPITVTEKPGVRTLEKAYFVSRLGQVSVTKQSSVELLLNTNSTFNEVLVVNTLFYPGWKAVVDGRTTPITTLKDRGLISLFVEQGQHEIRLHFDRTPVRWVADLMSLFGLALLIYIWSNSKKIFTS